MLWKYEFRFSDGGEEATLRLLHRLDDEGWQLVTLFQEEEGYLVLVRRPRDGSV